MVFYGLLLNAQLAAYAYKTAFHWIHVNMRRYTPVTTSHATASGTTIARNSYAEGVVAGLQESVEEAQREEAKRQREAKERLTAKLLRLQTEMAAPFEEQKIKASDLASAKCEYEESDEDDSSDDGENGTADQQGGSEEEEDGVPLGKMAVAAQQKRQMFLEGKIAKVAARLGKSDKRTQTEGALVVHQANVAETVLKTAGVKVSKRSACYAQRSGFDHLAYGKGKEDSRNIDLNRRALGGE